MTLDSQLLDQILNKTVSTVETSQRQIYELAEQALSERERLKLELEQVNQKIAEAIATTDRLDRELRQARSRLAEASRRFNRINEGELKRVYEQAHHLQMELRLSEEKEKQFRERRDDLQRRLKQMDMMIDKAQNLATQISVVLHYLTGDLSQVSKIIEEAKASQALGLKVIQAQEEERKRVAREIHDGPAQSLANVLLQTEIIDRTYQQGQSEQVKQEMEVLKRNVRETLSDIRRIIFDLRPMALDDLGLVPTLHKYMEKIKETHSIKAEFRVRGKEPQLPSAMVVALFRLAQEGITNVLKHARASHMLVKLDFNASGVYLVVQDNGRGFDPAQQHEEGFGLLGMKERVKLLEGEFHLSSRVGRGTKLVIKIPIKGKANTT
ncbi:putative signal transduction histidine kinase [Caldalkalibacillus thermarum TA2.A1]|uniref:Signal transduction histidine-protein kinase/phosphatase DegS n=1 Tax=Caldalkalibacillus thermarum (strain TA2.A1) TaxID=986075 RepID=F5L9B1_CALTT|nr:sensor histidine kinase [Caldalkalibacillus thermarum]EGL82053.1 putative signal transduction histidine kinase [Caldalkalibacillus thermarum TA2.A1]QZT34028.1 sensor histidine kinase [Caldalkalibacillus thermarum TA2.A1]